ncbi:hypothetical protein [Pseudomonas sp. efr-133-TYG-23]|uniref:hypothetical protein n=1 Tax=Pseudomonas sp. efr-133-TYG-23 TaxID=3040309 RepID=UPI002556F137|nr:hypothetical protein [Pseudomonas sp. efr-133-TYG-23]
MVADGTFFLKVAAIGNFPILTISKDEYQLLIKSKYILSVALSIEEKYDLTLCNFLDFEKELLVLAAENMVKLDIEYDRLYLVRSSMNKRVVNFLCSARMYTEQISRQASKCVVSESDVYTLLECLKSEIYDQSLSYRAMEAMRNHVNHSGVAVHGLSLPSCWKFENDANFKELVFNIDIFSERNILAENPKFKRGVLAELPEKVDLKRAIRSYMGAISRLHEEARKLIRNSVEEARAVIEYHLDEYSKINEGKAFAVGAYNYPVPQNKGSNKKPVMLTLNWDNVRRQLVERNDCISNMDKRFVTGSLTMNS